MATFPAPSASEATVSTSIDPLRTDLDRIRRHPLLKADEDRRLARLARGPVLSGAPAA